MSQKHPFSYAADVVCQVIRLYGVTAENSSINPTTFGELKKGGSITLRIQLLFLQSLRAATTPDEFNSSVLRIVYALLGNDVTKCDLLADGMPPGACRNWSKTELSQHLFPNYSDRASLNKFNRWLQRHSDLLARLETLGWHKGQHLVTPLQAEQILRIAERRWV